MAFWVSYNGTNPFSPEILAAILGGFLAGTFGIIATMISLLHAAQENQKVSAVKDEAVMHGIVTKLIDLNDFVLKHKRHSMIDGREVRVYFGPSGCENYFTKPLEGLQYHIEFTIDERSYLLRKFGAEYFNEITDIKGISDNFTFLKERHKRVFYDLWAEWHGTDIERDGYRVQGEINSDSAKLMAMMDADGALRSLVFEVSSVTHEFLLKMICLSNENTSVKISYGVNDLPPAASNPQRQTY